MFNYIRILIIIMKGYFFSSKNVNKLLNYFEKYIKIKKDDIDIRAKCKKFLINRMKLVFKIYGEKRPDNIKKKKFLDMLNKKTLVECIKLYKDRKKEKYYKLKKLNKSNLKITRDMEIYGNRKIKISTRPKHTQFKGSRDDSGTISYLSNSNIPDYAPIVGKGSRYITATGEATNRGFINNNEFDKDKSKSKSKTDIEMKMLERSSWYDNNSTNIPNEIDFSDSIDNIDNRNNRDNRNKFSNMQEFIQNEGRPSFKELEKERDKEYDDELDFNNNISNMNRREIPNMKDFNSNRNEIPNMKDFNSNRNEIPNMKDFNSNRHEISNMRGFNNNKQETKNRNNFNNKTDNNTTSNIYGVNKHDSTSFTSLNDAFNSDINRNIEQFNNFNNNRTYQDLINERNNLNNGIEQNGDIASDNIIPKIQDNNINFKKNNLYDQRGNALNKIQQERENNNLNKSQQERESDIQKLQQERENDITDIMNMNINKNKKKFNIDSYNNSNQLYDENIQQIYNNRNNDTTYINKIQNSIDVGPSISDINNLYNQLKKQIEFQTLQSSISNQISNIPQNISGEDKMELSYEFFKPSSSENKDKNMDIDVEKAMELLQLERKNMDSKININKEQEPFDPSISPFSIQNNNLKKTDNLNIEQLLNLQKKEELLLQNSSDNNLTNIDINKMSVEDIQNKIDLLKTSKLSMDEIQKKIDFFKTLVNNKKKRKKKNIDNSDKEDYNKYITELIEKKNELLDIVHKLKRNNNNKFIIEDSSDEDTGIDYTNIINEESDEHIINNNNLNINEVTILSKKDCKEEHCNNYTAKLSSIYNDVVGIELESCNIPSNNYNIIPLNNTFEYIINKRRKIIRIQEGKYDIDKLIKALCVGFEKYNDNIKIILENNYITIENKDRVKFYMIRCNKTISLLLGFKDINYENNHKYKAENQYNLSINNSFYLFIDNISNNYFAKIDCNNKKINLLNASSNFINNPIKTLSKLNLKFKYSSNKEMNDYYHFNNKVHKLNFKIITKKNKINYKTI
jgi:hypothetical protein